MNDFELEELESHLYSQVYHSNEDTDQNVCPLPVENSQIPESTMRKPNRYFQSDSKNNGTKFQRRHVVANQHNLKNPVCYDYTETQGIYSKDYSRPHKRDLSINQFVVLSTSQQPPIVCVSNSNQQKKRQRAAKWRSKFKEKKQKQKLAAQLLSEHKKSNKPVKCDIITLSDTDDESCIEIKKDWPVVSVTDSDDENKSMLKKEATEELPQNEESAQNITDDVIFIEPVNTPDEIINLDEEAIAQKSSDDINVHPDIETASVTSSTNSFLNYSPSKSRTINLHQERKELLSTPDSASNDFMNNSGLELNQSNFNFSLHGADFTNDKFLKPANPTDPCETESSSSTTDLYTLNTMKTAVFSEIEFPKEDMFSEANLESFGDLITPSRKRASKEPIRASTPIEETREQDQNVYSSDSSSESDFEEAVDRQKELLKTSKNLPDLSPMHLNNKTLQGVGKKSKKQSSISSKYDLINTSAEIVVKKTKQKKRKSTPAEVANLSAELNTSKKKSKNKKRKTDTEQAEATCSTIETDAIKTNETETTKLIESGLGVTENDAKQKKRKSSSVIEESCENLDSSHSKKRTKNKKKKNVSGAESEDNGTDLESSVQVEKSLDEQKEKTESSVPIEQTEIAVDPVIEKNQNEDDQIVEERQESNVALEDCSKPQECTNPPQDGIGVFLPAKTEEKEESKVISSLENVKVIKEETSPSTQSIDENPLDGFTIVDETFEKETIEVLSSDSDSNLSALQGQQDIQLINLKEPDLFKIDTKASAVEITKPLNLTDHSLEEVQYTMSNDPKLWEILDSDRMPSGYNPAGRRCNRCRERGHMAVRCPNKVVPKCNLCGESGHYEPRCPNRICTQCGERSPYSTNYCKFCFHLRQQQCQICFMIGHAAKTCPDLWRRYHLTIEDGPLIVHNGPVLKSKEKLWCSGCAQSGHVECDCRFFQSVYPPADPRIKSYDNIYGSRAVSRPRNSYPPQAGPSLVQYPINQFNRNNIQPQGPLRHNFPIMYNQSNRYPINSYPNHEFRQMHGAFRNNQAINVVPSRRSEPIHDRNNYLPQNEFYFEDNLPNFISFDTPPPSAPIHPPPLLPPPPPPLLPPPNPPLLGNNTGNYGQVPLEGRYFHENDHDEDKAISNNPKRDIRRNCGVFFSSTSEHILDFLDRELTKLIKLSYHVKSVVRSLKKQTNEQGSTTKIKKYYKTLNMVLFGIYKLNEGEKHLVKLKTFRLKGKTKLSQQKREELYRSYSYIFGLQKHSGVDYLKLLRRI